MDDERQPLGQHGGPAPSPERRENQRQRRSRGDGGAGGRQLHRIADRRQHVVPWQRGVAREKQPIGQHGERHAERQCDQRGEPRRGRQCPPSQPRRDVRCGGARSRSGEAPPAAQQQFRRHDAEAQDDQDGRQHRGGGAVVAQFVGFVDGGREGLDAQERQRPELDQHVKRHEQQPARQRRHELRQHGAAEDPPGTMADGSGHVFERRVHAPQRRRDRQVDERVFGEDLHQHRAGHPLDAGRQRQPGEGRDQGRHGERQRHQHAPPPAARQVGAFDEPSRGGADEERARRHRHGERQRVQKQVRHEGTKEQPRRAGPADRRGLRHHIGEGQQRQGRHGSGGQPKPERRRGWSAPAPHGQAESRLGHQLMPTACSSSSAEDASPISAAVMGEAAALSNPFRATGEATSGRSGTSPAASARTF